MFLSFSGLLPSTCPVSALRRALLAAACWLYGPWAAATTEILPVQRIASDVYVITAPLADASPSNGGRVVNTGFVIGRTGVVVIDSGANHRHGEAILAAVARVTKKPVALLINTHPHPHNVLGNSAFADRGIPIMATSATVTAMTERCPACLASLSQSVGDEPMRGTRIQLPDTPVAGSQTLEVAGRQLRLLHLGHGHTEGDLAVFDEATAVLFAGDLVYGGQVPHLSEANTTGWIAALNQVAALPVRILVSGRGPVGGAGDLEPTLRYLSELRQRVAAAYQEGRTPDEAIKLAELPEFSDWHGYAARHGRNVQHVYFEIERDDMGGQSEARR
jgi:glyoxylase-like metal-dependent hydrolase (beta-lactamase superfamily II)